MGERMLPEWWRWALDGMNGGGGRRLVKVGGGGKGSRRRKGAAVEGGRRVGKHMLIKLRSTSVSNETLAHVAIKHELHRFTRHPKPDLLNVEIRGFIKRIKDYPPHFTGLVDPSKILADIIETLVGAIFIDSDTSMNDTLEDKGWLVKVFADYEIVGRGRHYEIVGRGRHKTNKKIARQRELFEAYN
ncbi:hypothetical protein OSB04_023886, partial [Centaurea solstitialis]